jgi:hypothetical protein
MMINHAQPDFGPNPILERRESLRITQSRGSPWTIAAGAGTLVADWDGLSAAEVVRSSLGGIFDMVKVQSTATLKIQTPLSSWF